MKPLDEHRAELKEICDYAFGYGMKTIGIELHQKHGLPDKWSAEDRLNFMIKTHEGIKIAQKKLIDSIMYYQESIKTSDEQRKLAHQSKDRETASRLATEIKVYKSRLKAFYHIGDGIAWQIFGSQIHIARRLYIGEQSNKQLDSSNLDHALRVADDINEDPLSIALISDLTNFVQIGDLLVGSPDSLKIIELKEGGVNEELQEILKENSNKDSDSLTEAYELLDKGKKDQYDRMKRQIDRMQKVEAILSNDEGIDPVSGQHINVRTPETETIFYHDVLALLEKQLEKKFWAYNVVDTCLHIGMYRDEGLAMMGLIEDILKKESDNIIVVDYQSILSNISEPLFSKPWNPEFLIDIMTANKKIIVGINLDRFIELLNQNGLNAAWMNKKETAKIREELSKKNVNGLFILNNRAIKVTGTDDKEFYIMGGVISKMLYDNISPLSIVSNLMEV